MASRLVLSRQALGRNLCTAKPADKVVSKPTTTPGRTTEGKPTGAEKPASATQAKEPPKKDAVPPAARADDPQSRGGFGKYVALAVVGGGGYTLYQMENDAGFKKNIDAMVPGAAKIVDGGYLKWMNRTESVQNHVERLAKEAPAKDAASSKSPAKAPESSPSPQEKQVEKQAESVVKEAYKHAPTPWKRSPDENSSDSSKTPPATKASASTPSPVDPEPSTSPTPAPATSVSTSKPETKAISQPTASPPPPPPPSDVKSTTPSDAPVSPAAVEKAVAAAAAPMAPPSDSIQAPSRPRPDDLQREVDMLEDELNHRARTEGIRMEEALAENSKRLKDEYTAHFNEILKQRLAAQHEVLVSQMRTEADKSKREALQRQAAEYEQRLTKELRANTEKLNETWKTETNKLQLELKRTFDEESKKRQEALDDVIARTTALEQVFQSETTYQVTSHRVHKVNLAAHALNEKLGTDQPFDSEVSMLTSCAGGDPYLETVLAPLTHGIAETGVATNAELVDRFEAVAKHARRASLVPRDGGLWNHALAYVVSLLKFEEKGLIAGDSNEARVARARYYVNSGDLLKAVGEAEELDGLPREIVSDWLSAARARLLVDQSVHAVLAYAATLAASLS